ncbi:hypothetical protein GOBAR_DD07743 [Gossypium barbadense]|nr:hypothetical protein GOBAR_DD07743 [Gossypium barbadense]
MIQNIDINYSTVADLFDRETTTWKLEALRKLFVKDQVNKILTIPVAEVDLEDGRVWRGNKTREEQCKWLTIVFWAVWHYRNKVYHEESTFTELVISLNISQNDSTWTPSGLNEVKCNFDAAFNRCMFSSVSGIIFRNNEGYILATCTYSNSFVADATTTEVRDCLQATTALKS